MCVERNAAEMSWHGKDAKVCSLEEKDRSYVYFLYVNKRKVNRKGKLHAYESV